MVNSRIQELRRRADTALASFALAKARLRAAEEDRASRAGAVAAALEAQALAQHLALEVQTQAHRRLAGVVTQALAAVFDHAYEFKLDFSRSRGRTEVGLKFYRDGQEFDPMYSTGGGVLDIAGMVLRMAAVMASHPPVRRLLVLDEPMKNLSEAYREKAAVLIARLAEELDFQILLITHFDEFKMGVVHQL